MKGLVVRLVAVCYFVGLAGTMTEFSVAPVTPVFQRHLHISSGSAGLLMSLFALATVIAALPAGRFTHRFGAKATQLLGLALSAIGAVVLMTAYHQGNFLAVLAARFFSGLGFGLISVGAPAAISQQVPDRYHAAAMGVWATWVPVGSVVMFVVAPLLGHLASVAPLEDVLVACDIVAALALAAVPMRRITWDGTDSGAPTMSPAIRNPMLWVALAFTCFTFDFFAFNTWVTTFYTQRFHLTLVHAGLIAAVVSLVNAGFNVVSGMALAHPKTRWYLVFVVPAWILAGLWVIFAYGSWPVVLTASLLTGALGGVIPTLIFAAPGRLAQSPHDVPGAMALVIIGENVGIVMGPPIFGAVIEPLHFASGFWVLGAVSVLMAWALSHAVRRLKPNTSAVR
ncbi:MAG: hypothetical protein C7B44_05855 [Sulfobacillus thermosulfidooxidans]|nr:MAG: hypothetical protein C7B44_05855 [Sulfobacillus thermosulfidooxidans]